MLLLQDVEMLKELPGYKAILKAVLKAQIQSLVGGIVTLGTVNVLKFHILMFLTKWHMRTV